MAKVLSEGNHGITFAKGGDTKMFGKGHVRTKVPGISGKEDNTSSSGKWAEGGSTKMHGRQHAGLKEPFHSGKCDGNG